MARTGDQPVDPGRWPATNRARGFEVGQAAPAEQRCAVGISPAGHAERRDEEGSDRISTHPQIVTEQGSTIGDEG